MVTWDRQEQGKKIKRGKREDLPRIYIDVRFKIVLAQLEVGYKEGESVGSAFPLDSNLAIIACAMPRNGKFFFFSQALCMGSRLT